jgi:4-hydroxy-tetrahydrodipicolinate reductase
MGQAVDEQASRRGHRRKAVIDPSVQGAGFLPEIGASALRGVDVAFEFTLPGSAEQNVLALLRAGLPVVCGTTGWRPSESTERAMREAGPGVVLAPNFSVGMNLFYRLVREAARLYGAAGLHQPFVFEAHHRAKKDVPSGTARRLSSILVETDPRLSQVHEGNPEEPLPDDTLHVCSVRAGGEPGSHTVGYDGEHDRITLTHGARSRAGFALGAVLAAEWVTGRSGLHGFDEVLEAMLDASPGAGK